MEQIKLWKTNYRLFNVNLFVGGYCCLQNFGSLENSEEKIKTKPMIMNKQ